MARIRTIDQSGTATLVATVLGFFVITLDAVIVNVALPAIQRDLGGGMTGSQWVVDGYTLMFAALLLSAGALSDRIGARRAFGVGTSGFLAASLACALAPTPTALVAARFVQGAAAALMMPASMTLLRLAYPDPVARGRAVAVWAIGGSVAATAGPVLGGALTVLSWRAIFLINLPVGLVALALLCRAPVPARQPVALDRVGQLSAVAGMCALTYGAIEAGSAGLASPTVLAALGLAVASFAVFATAERRVRHPMLPPAVIRSATVRAANFIGFAFMVGYYGLPFVMSLYLQQHRGLSALATGLIFLPMMVVGLVLTPFSARLAERVGPRVLIVGGLLAMACGLVLLAIVPTASVGVPAALMMLVGLAGPLVMPPTIALLLNAVPAERAGVTAGAFHTSRQLGGALAVAVFGALLAPAHVLTGLRVALLIAAGIAVAAAWCATTLRASARHCVAAPDTVPIAA